ncbi:MAG: hypothetical protein GX096_01525 [Clostridiales bacterium]|nr:hypothetical protein [Clostridiales bacterium]
MKKILAIMLVLCMLIPLCAFAEKNPLKIGSGYRWGMTLKEADALAKESPFVLRSGFHWGMTLEEVEALGDKEGLIKNDYESFVDVPVGAYTARMRFWDQTSNESIERLTGVFYSFFPIRQDVGSPENLQMYNDLKEGLIATYGEPIKIDDRYSPPDYEWLVYDTSISLLMKGEREDRPYCSIMYMFRPDLIPAPTPEPTLAPTPIPTAAPVPNSGF